MEQQLQDMLNDYNLDKAHPLYHAIQAQLSAIRQFRGRTITQTVDLADTGADFIADLEADIRAGRIPADDPDVQEMLRGMRGDVAELRGLVVDISITNIDDSPGAS